MNISNWMSWEGGVDLMATSAPGLPIPNVVVHIARMVHTPVGSAPAGLIFLPDADPSAPPLLMGFISTDPRVGDYFGPHIFAGTPFENAPVLRALVEIETDESSARAKICVAQFVVEVALTSLGETRQINRPVGAMPFTQQGLERDAGQVQLRVGGALQPIEVVSQSLTGGYGAVFSVCGSYAR